MDSIAVAHDTGGRIKGNGYGTKLRGYCASGSFD